MKKNTDIYKQVYLSRIVSFDQESLLFDRYEIQMPFDTEEFCLTTIIGDWAYNLEKRERYHIIDMEDGYIPYEELSALAPNQKYAYESYEFNDIWDSLRSVLRIDKDITSLLQSGIEEAHKYHDELSECKIYSFDSSKVISIGQYKRKNNGND